jgi:hypothetical protein
MAGKDSRIRWKAKGRGQRTKELEVRSRTRRRPIKQDYGAASNAAFDELRRDKVGKLSFEPARIVHPPETRSLLLRYALCALPSAHPPHPAPSFTLCAMPYAPCPQPYALCSPP